MGLHESEPGAKRHRRVREVHRVQITEDFVGHGKGFEIFILSKAGMVLSTGIK